MEEVASNTLEALINLLFDDDLVHTNIPTTTAPIILPEEPIQVQFFPAPQDENGTNHKSATNMKPGKIAAYLQQECRPWLKQKPLGDQANSSNEEAKQKHKPQPPATKKKKKKRKKDSTSTALYHKVMEEVANKTRGAFLEHYGDDVVHSQFQELWKLKMKNKKVKSCFLAGNVPPEGVATPLHDRNPPYERREECGSGTFIQETDRPLEPLRTTTSIPFPGESRQFQCLPAYQDGNGTSSKPAAYMKLDKTSSCKQQRTRPWHGNAGFEGEKPKKFKPPPPAKQQLHQPWLKQKPFGNQDNAGLEEARQKSQLQPPEMNFKENLKNNIVVKKLDLDSNSYPTKIFQS